MFIIFLIPITILIEVIFSLLMERPVESWSILMISAIFTLDIELVLIRLLVESSMDNNSETLLDILIFFGMCFSGTNF